MLRQRPSSIVFDPNGLHLAELFIISAADLDDVVRTGLIPRIRAGGTVSSDNPNTSRINSDITTR